MVITSTINPQTTNAPAITPTMMNNVISESLVVSQLILADVRGSVVAVTDSEELLSFEVLEDVVAVSVVLVVRTEEEAEVVVSVVLVARTEDVLPTAVLEDAVE
jgi:hypothetical protein